MAYKIMVSNGYDSYNFYEDSYDKAMLLYSMAIHSGMFVYVELSRLKENYIPMEEWSED